MVLVWFFFVGETHKPNGRERERMEKVQWPCDPFTKYHKINSYLCVNTFGLGEAGMEEGKKMKKTLYLGVLNVYERVYALCVLVI